MPPEESLAPPDDAFEGVDVDADIADLAATFLHARFAEMNDLHRALERGDLASLRQAAHNIAGAGGGYGFPRLSALGFDLGAAVRAGDVTAARATLHLTTRYLIAWIGRYG